MKVTYQECPECKEHMVFLFENGGRYWWCPKCGIKFESKE